MIVEGNAPCITHTGWWAHGIALLPDPVVRPATRVRRPVVFVPLNLLIGASGS